MQVLNAETEDFLAKLVAACGISGNSEDVAQLVRLRLQMPHIQVLPDEAGLQVVQAVVNPQATFRVMLQAHMDVVGMRVTHIDDKGFCYFRSVGGIDVLALKGQKVRIHTRQGPVKGLIQGFPLHHTEHEGRDKGPKIDEFYVRTEMVGKSEVSLICVGDPIVFDTSLDRLGKDILIGPGFDDRLGVLLIVELMRRLSSEKLKIGLYGVASSGEEIGCRGVRALAQKIAPQLAIAVDVTNATDYPNANPKKWGAQKLGLGPVIARGYNTRTIYNEKLMDLARELKIPFQLRAEDITPTDGREIDEAGIPTVVVRVPASMLHTAHDTVHRADLETTFTLLFEFLQRLGSARK